MSQAIIKKKERRVIIIQGYSKDDQEYNIFSATRMSVARYFASITGGAFDNNEIIQITNTTHTLNKLNDEIDNLTVDIAIFVFMGHGAIQDGKQLFQFSEDEIFYPGQFNYKAPKTLVLVDSCRVPISGCRVESLSKIIPSFIDGGKFRRPITRAEAKSIYNNAFTTIADGMTICFHVVKMKVHTVFNFYTRYYINRLRWELNLIKLPLSVTYFRKFIKN